MYISGLRACACACNFRRPLSSAASGVSYIISSTLESMGSTTAKAREDAEEAPGSCPASSPPSPPGSRRQIDRDVSFRREHLREPSDLVGINFDMPTDAKAVIGRKQILGSKPLHRHRAQRLFALVAVLIVVLGVAAGVAFALIGGSEAKGTPNASSVSPPAAPPAESLPAPIPPPVGLRSPPPPVPRLRACSRFSSRCFHRLPRRGAL